MYRPDVMQLRRFYSSMLGRTARMHLEQSIRHLWPQLNKDMTIGLGYAAHFLRPYLQQESDKATDILALMPAGQGAMAWPSHQDNRSILCMEHQLPLRDNLCNRLVLAHMLENADSPDALLRECWRVLTPGGRMLIIVPNRRSIWSVSNHSPFSYGKPYSFTQLETLLNEHQFTLTGSNTALFMFASQNRLLLRLAPALEKIGNLLWPMLGGVIIMEVEKQIYAAVREKITRRALAPAYRPAAKPALTRGVDLILNILRRSHKAG